MRNILGLRNISVYGKANDRLKKVNLKIREGEKIALIGSSGAGKSTLIAVANGSNQPHSGEVLWKGKSLRRISNKSRKTPTM